MKTTGPWAASVELEELRRRNTELEDELHFLRAVPAAGDRTIAEMSRETTRQVELYSHSREWLARTLAQTETELTRARNRIRELEELDPDAWYLNEVGFEVGRVIGQQTTILAGQVILVDHRAASEQGSRHESL